VLWRTKNKTPEGEYDVRKMKIKVDGRGTATLSGTLTFDVLEKLPRHSYVVRLQCGAPNPRGTVKWTGVRFSDFAQAVGAQSFANYCRLVGSDAYFIDEDMTILMHPQVVLAWQLNDAPIPPEHGAPLRLIVPFRYGARSLKAITEIQFTATSFAPPKPWPT
jgi:DMSO/TMAO reductase YedYZ molybdopterin-dependent catalytic subunit